MICRESFRKVTVLFFFCEIEKMVCLERGGEEKSQDELRKDGKHLKQALDTREPADPKVKGGTWEFGAKANSIAWTG